MSDPAATFRALADACDACATFDRDIRSQSMCSAMQRDALMCALPHGGWPATATTLRAMADEVERLRAVIDNPGDVAAQISIVGFDRVRLAHAETVSVTLTSAMLRDHLRARLGVSDV